MVHEHIGPFAPVNATAATLWFEQANIDGDGLGNIAYGVHLTLFIMTFNVLWKLRHEHPKYSYGTMLYVFALFTLGTIYNFANMHYVEQEFVDDINYPGGPVAWEIFKNDIPGLTAYVITLWLQDAIIIHRFFVIYGRKWWIIIVPCIGFLASIVLSCDVLWGLNHHGQTFLSSSNLSTTSYSISVGTTIILTLAIVFRLMSMRRSLRAAVGRKHAAPYVSISAMLIESAFVYTAFALPHTIMVGLHNPGELLTVVIVGQVQSISCLLIVLRVAKGQAWSCDTVRQANVGHGRANSHQLGSLKFHSQSKVGSTTAAESSKYKYDDSTTQFTSNTRDTRSAFALSSVNSDV